MYNVELNSKNEHRYSTFLERKEVDILYRFFTDDKENKVFFLTGLRKSGKTAMIYHCAYRLENGLIYCSCNDDTQVVNIFAKLNNRYNQGYRLFVVERIDLIDDYNDCVDKLVEWTADKEVKLLLTGMYLENRKPDLDVSYLPFNDYYRIYQESFRNYMMAGGTMSCGLFTRRNSTDNYIRYCFILWIQKELKSEDDGIGEKVREIFSYYVKNDNGYEDCFIKDCLKKLRILKAIKTFDEKGNSSDFEYLLYPGIYGSYCEKNLFRIASNIICAELDYKDYKVSRCILDNCVYIVAEDEYAIKALSADGKNILPDRRIEEIYQKKLVKYVPLGNNPDRFMDRFYSEIK